MEAECVTASTTIEATPEAVFAWSDPTDQEVIGKLPDTPIHRSPMGSTGTPTPTRHNEPTEWTIQ
jgi:hypothetical protein